MWKVESAKWNVELRDGVRPGGAKGAGQTGGGGGAIAQTYFRSLETLIRVYARANIRAVPFPIIHHIHML